jgi:hypothetical protein
MAVREQTPPKAPLRGIKAAPLTHTHLDKAAPWIRLLLGLAVIAYTSYTTISGVGQDLAPVLRDAPDYMPLAVGLGVAIFLSGGEWLTSEHVPAVYAILLLIDAHYTQVQIGPWIDKLAAYHLASAPALAASVVSFLVSWGLSIAMARYGEILLFGRRKKG